MINFFKFYRLINYNSKIAWTRCLAYVILGYAVSGTFKTVPMALNLLIISAICMTAFSLNDYIDHKSTGEKNYVGKLRESGVSKKTLILLIVFPLVALAGLPYINHVSAILLLVFLAVTIAYSLPKINLKKRYGFLYSPACAVIGFWESFLIGGRWNASIIFLSGLILFFHAYTEAVHILEEYQANERKNTEKKIAYTVLRGIPFVTLILAIIFSFYNPVFVLGIIFSTVRIIGLRKINMKSDFYKLHRNLFNNIYAPFEFAGYAILGVFRYLI